jgi:hypothetical protein
MHPILLNAQVLKIIAICPTDPHSSQLRVLQSLHICDAKRKAEKISIILARSQLELGVGLLQQTTNGRENFGTTSGQLEVANPLS